MFLKDGRSRLPPGTNFEFTLPPLLPKCKGMRVNKVTTGFLLGLAPLFWSDLARAQTDPTPPVVAQASPSALEDLKSYMERTFTIEGSLRARWEATQGSNFSVTPSDSYMLTRIRLGLGFAPTPWLRFFGEAMDARAEFYKVTPPSSVDDPIDWRQGWVEAGKLEGNGVRVRFGRQELQLGSGRLIGNPDWSNVGKSYDIVRGTITAPGFTADVLAGSPLLVDTTRMDRSKPGEHFYVDYNTFRRLIKNAKVEPYFIARTALNVKGKNGVLGTEETLIGGLRVIGKLPFGFDYSGEGVREGGHYSADTVQAFAYVADAGWTTPTMPWNLHPNTGYIGASGDDGRKDGYHQAFDGLYGLNQPMNSLTGLFGWRNLAEWHAGADFSPRKNLVVKVDYRDYWLATLADGLYNASAVRTVFDAKATSGHVGSGLDTQFTTTFAKKNIVGIGVGFLTPGSYLKQAGKTSGFVYPYLSYTRVL